jgi:hypothetical protein
LSLQLAASARAEEPKQLSDKEIKALIEKLTSPNPEPKAAKDPCLKVPADFDRKKQELVNQAFEDLHKAGPQAFSQLVASWEDKRYSITVAHCLSGAYYNWTVGEACRAIIYDQLQPYGTWQEGGGDPRSMAHRPGYPHEFLWTEKETKDWLAARKAKSLGEMQLEILDWIVGEEAKEPDKFTKSEKDKLQQRRKELADGRKPLTGITMSYGCWEVEKRFQNR